ncbi:ABC transporter substrate-binding protein [Fodinicurvata sp. EGI_FJ10296]|uniref:ABC transporter substrate-binding protein n=1 Tax=Fodinicurvata sp. EGI_FJ10296 TaxID=3231908 RepID=UPI003451EF2D
MTKSIYRYEPTRRTLIKVGATAAAAGIVAGRAPAIIAADRSIRIGSYGGYFEESFVSHIYPGFTDATGIAVESVPEPTGEAWLIQLQQAARAGQAPADVSMMAQGPMLRGINAGLWQPFDPGRLPNVDPISESFLNRTEDGELVGVPAVAWFITLVTNTDSYPEAPTSWADMWDPANEGRVGLLALPSNSFLLEITASTFFGGTDILSTEDGLTEVMEKLAEIRSNVALWYRDEGQFQNALQSGEIPMGQYYHDVAGLAAADGFPVRSTFPEEGGVSDRGSWAVTTASEKLDEAHEFINYMCQPDIQDILARQVGTAPVIPRDLTSLTDAEFDAVSSEIEPIIPRYDLYLEQGDELNQRWTEMITG